MNKKYLSLLIPYSLLTILTPFLASAASFDRDLTLGSKGTDVESLQNFLTEQGAYSGPVTGYFGNLTKEGVKKFQTENGISPVSGYFGPLSRSVANGKVSAPVVSVPLSSEQQIVADLQRQIEELLKQLAALQTPAVVAPAPIVITPPSAPEVITPAPSVLPSPFVSPMTIVSDYPSRTLSGYTNAILNEFKLSSVPEKLAITKLRLTNDGTFSDVYFNNINLINSFTGEVLATMDAPVNNIADFILTPNAAKANKGLMVSGGTYTITADLRTPTYGGTKPYIQLNIATTSDMIVVDYDTLNRTADISTANIFPISGPRISAF